MSSPNGGNGGGGAAGGVTPTPSGPIGNHLPRMIGSIQPPRPTTGAKGPKAAKKPTSKPKGKKRK